MKVIRTGIVLFCQTLMILGYLSVSAADPVETPQVRSTPQTQTRPHTRIVVSAQKTSVFSKGDEWVLSVKGVMGPMSPFEQKAAVNPMDSQTTYTSNWKDKQVTLSIKTQTKIPVRMSIQWKTGMRLVCHGFLPHRNRNIVTGFCKDPEGENSSWFAYRKKPQNLEKKALKQTQNELQICIDKRNSCLNAQNILKNQIRNLKNKITRLKTEINRSGKRGDASLGAIGNRIRVPGGTPGEACEKCDQTIKNNFPQNPKKAKKFMKELQAHHDNLLNVIRLAFSNSDFNKYKQIESGECNGEGKTLCRIRLRENVIHLIVEEQFK